MDIFILLSLAFFSVREIISKNIIHDYKQSQNIFLKTMIIRYHLRNHHKNVIENGNNILYHN